MRSERRHTFHLRSLLLIVACSAAVMGIARFIFTQRPHQLYSVVVPALSGVVAWLWGAWLGGILGVRFRVRFGVTFSALSFVATVFILFARYRCSESVLFDDLAWPRCWPYPDEALATLNEWFDRQYPARDGSLKIHSEFPKIRFILDSLIFVLSSASGFVCPVIMLAGRNLKGFEPSQ